MARIIESSFNSRRTIKMSVDDIISIVKEYQRVTQGCKTYEQTRLALKSSCFFVPEDV